MPHPTPDIIIESTEPWTISTDGGNAFVAEEVEMIGWNDEEDRIPDYPTSSPWTDETVKEV